MSTCLGKRDIISRGKWTSGSKKKREAVCTWGKSCEQWGNYKVPREIYLLFPAVKKETSCKKIALFQLLNCFMGDFPRNTFLPLWTVCIPTLPGSPHFRPNGSVQIPPFLQWKRFTLHFSIWCSYMSFVTNALAAREKILSTNSKGIEVEGGKSGERERWGREGQGEEKCEGECSSFLQEAGRGNLGCPPGLLLPCLQAGLPESGSLGDSLLSQPLLLPFRLRHHCDAVME